MFGIKKYVGLYLHDDPSHPNKVYAMFHNGAGSNGGHDSGSSLKDLKKLPQTPGSSTATQGIITKNTSKTNKQHQQSNLERPSVLRKGNQTLSHGSSNQPVVGNYSIELVFKKEMDNKLQEVDTDYIKKNNTSEPSPAPNTTEQHPYPKGSENFLFNKGVCTWPGCKEAFKEYNHFLKHVYSEHSPGDKTIEQWRIQKNMVECMEKQLVMERQRLHSMYLHLFDTNSIKKPSSTPSGSLQSCQSLSILHAQNTTSSDMLTSGYWRIPATPIIPGIVPSIECYKYTNIRPPFTYASMIRWAILESQGKQLTLNEIYHWFTIKFFYFRHNTATWKNAVRHNLSLHKCFVRVDGGKGSVWTVDEAEFLRKRGQKLQRDQDMNWVAHYSMFYS